MKHVKLFEGFVNSEMTSRGKVAIYVGLDGSDVTVLDKGDAEMLISKLKKVDGITIDYKELIGDEKYVIWDPNNNSFDYSKYPNSDGYVIYPGGNTNYERPDSDINSENWSMPLLYNKVVSVDGGQGNRVTINDNPVSFLIDKYSDDSNIPPVEYVGRAGDKVTVMLEDGGYVGILSDADHAKLEAQRPRELYRIPAAGKSFVIANNDTLDMGVSGEDADLGKCAFWVNADGMNNPNSEYADDRLTCFSIPPAGQIISIEAAGSGDEVVLYRNVDELISEVYGD
jgi:hypothetical protein